MAKWGLVHVTSLVYVHRELGLGKQEDWATYTFYGESTEAQGRQDLDSKKVGLFIAHLLNDGWEPLTFAEHTDPSHGNWVKRHWTFKKKLEE